MTDVDNATPLKLDPISAQIIRRYLLQSIEHIDDEDLEAGDLLAEEEAGEDEDK